jgi:hypothetical protein
MSLSIMHFWQNAHSTKSEDGIRHESCVEERRPSHQSLPKAMGLTPAPFKYVHKSMTGKDW